MVERTIYIGSLDSRVSDMEVVSYFSSCGRVCNFSFGGDPQRQFRFAFMEFASVQAVEAAVRLSGSTITPYGFPPASRPMRITPSKSPITTPPPPCVAQYGGGLAPVADLGSHHTQPSTSATAGAQAYGAYSAYAGYPGYGYQDPYQTSAPPQSHSSMSAPSWDPNTLEAIARTLYVSGVSNELTEDDLKSLFATFGEVTEVKLCGDPEKSKRFAFVEYDRRESARQALNLSGQELDGVPIRVTQSKTAIVRKPQPALTPETREKVKRTLHVANLDKSITESELKSLFSSVGHVEQLMLCEKQDNTSRFAFVEFGSPEEAAAALLINHTEIRGKRIRISQAKAPIYPNTPAPDAAALVAARLNERLRRQKERNPLTGEKREHDEDEAQSKRQRLDNSD